MTTDNPFLHDFQCLSIKKLLTMHITLKNCVLGMALNCIHWWSSLACCIPLHCNCDNTPSAPQIHHLLQTISLLGQWSTCGSDRGIAHFFIATRNTIKGVGGKNKRTNEQYELGLTQAQEEELCNIAFPCAYLD